MKNFRLYDLLNLLAFFALWFMNERCLDRKLLLGSRPLNNIAVRTKKKSESKTAAKKRLRKLAFWEILVLSLLQFLSGGAMNKVVGILLNHGSLNYFGFAILAPLIFLLVCTLAKVDPFGHLDLFTPGYAISLAFFKLGCFTEGCCRGMETEIWFWYPYGADRRFPVQLVEMTLAILIFIFLLRYRRKAKPGTMQPVYLIAYSGTRFFSEFLRGQENVFLCFKMYQILCFAGVLIGILELYLVTRNNGALPEKLRIRAATPYPNRRKSKQKTGTGS